MPPGASPGKREISLNQGKFEAMHKFILYSFFYEVFPVFSLREQYMHTLIHIMLRNFGRAVVALNFAVTRRSLIDMSRE